MNISAELSLYPLDNDYEQIVWDFINALKQNTQIEIVTNGMSTQVFGDIEQVMPTITQVTKQLYQEKRAILVMKIGKGTLKL